MRFLTLEQLLQLHILAVAAGGGSTGLRDMGRLESAVASQHQAVFGEQVYKTLFEKSAAIARGIIGDHPFVDGNKRTAMLAALTLLEINGQKFEGEKGELEDFAVKIAIQKLDVKAIAAWLRNHSQPKT